MKTFLFIVILLFNSILFCQIWESTNGPLGGYLTYINSDSKGNLYAGSWDGLYKSSDNGISWTSMNFSNKEIYCIISDKQDNLFIATDPTFKGTKQSPGLYRCMQNTKEWNLVINGMENEEGVRSIAIDSSGKMFAGMVRGGIYTSTDKGNNWSYSGLAKEFIRKIYIDKNNNIYACSDYAGLYYSNDCGISWNLLQVPLCGYLTSVLVSSAGYIYASTWIPFANTYGGVYCSTDKGKSWMEKNNGIYDKEICSLFIDTQGNLFAGTANGLIYITNNEGESWTESFKGFTSSTINSIITNSGKMFVATQGAGIFSSSDKGGNWSLCSSLASNIYSTAIGENKKNQILCGSYGGVFRLCNNTWIGQSEGLPFSEVISFIPVDSNKIIAATYGNGIFKSYDNGLTWENVIKNFGCNPNSVSSVNSKIYAYLRSSNGEDDKNGVYCSEDSGNSWYILGKPNTQYISSMCVNSKKIIFAVTEKKIYRSKDEGITWEIIKSYSGYSNVIYVDKKNIIYMGTSDGEVYRSEDNGETWTTSHPCNTRIFSIVTSEDNSIFIGTEGEGVFTSSDGLNWRSLNTGLNNMDVKNLFISSDNILYAGTAKGVFKCKLLPTSVENEYYNNHALDYQLFPNFPNPFNPTTSIQYQLPKAGHTTIKVFNSIGKEIVTLVDEYKEEGKYTANFNGTELSSGIYFVTMRSGEFVQSKKMLLVK